MTPAKAPNRAYSERSLDGQVGGSQNTQTSLHGRLIASQCQNGNTTHADTAYTHAFSAVDLLRRRGQMRAAEIARELDADPVDVYVELVRAEACGQVRVVVERVQNAMPVKSWEAI